tara:strand:+ start:43 stop:672 length:630 start_codon:yes stop_codon:yes gene_type:complete
MNRIKAVIFDMDGVLIDAKDWHYESLNQALILFGFEISRKDHLVNYDGLPTKKKLEMLSQERGLPRELHDFINEIKQDLTIKTAFVKCKPSFNQLYALNLLKENGYRLAACSNSVRKTIEILFDKSKITKFFEFYLSNEDVNFPKPNPEMYESAIKRLNLDPKECLVLEDNENGINSALAAGAHVMVIDKFSEVNYHNIMDQIKKIEDT